MLNDVTHGSMVQTVVAIKMVFKKPRHLVIFSCKVKFYVTDECAYTHALRHLQ